MTRFEAAGIERKDRLRVALPARARKSSDSNAGSAQTETEIVDRTAGSTGIALTANAVNQMAQEVTEGTRSRAPLLFGYLRTPAVALFSSHAGRRVTVIET